MVEKEGWKFIDDRTACYHPRQWYEKRFVYSLYGFAVTVIILFVSTFSLFGWINISPGPFGGGWGEGLFLQPTCGECFLSISPLGYMFIGVLVLIPILIANIIQKSQNSRRLAALAAMISYFDILAISYFTPVGIGGVREGLSVLRMIGFIAQLVFVLSIYFTFSKPIVPEWTKYESDISFYVANQWRKAQTILSTVFAGIIGASIPFAINFTETFGPMVLMLTIGALIIPPFGIAAFFITRILLLERERR